MKALTMYLFALLLLIVSSGNSQVKTLIMGHAVDRSLSNGERHTYQVELEPGGFLYVTVEQMGIDVAISVISPNGEKLTEVDSPTGTQGKENVTIEAQTAGNYRLEVHPFEEDGSDTQPVSGKYRIQIEELLSATEYEERIETKRMRHQATIQWLKENAIQLKGVEAGQGFDDLEPLKEIIGNARLVSLGEATHGTREFFQLKHRMLEFLVEEMGFNIFAIEATMPEGFDVNEYVLTGKGDPEKALAGLYFWTWNTEEVLGMIRWMRQYNADTDHKNKVKFYGFDMQSGTRAIKVLHRYLSRVDAQSAVLLQSNEVFARIMNPYTANDFRNEPLENKNATLEILESILENLNSKKVKYISETDEKEWELAQLHAQILMQYIQYNLPVNNFTASGVIRDSSMAQNVRWVLEQEGADAKIVLWAHNAHVNTKPGWMGQFLQDMYGDEMVIFGLCFNQGSFQAIEMPFGAGNGLIPFHVKPLPEESLDATLGATGLPFAAVNLNRLPETGVVAEWFSEPFNSRNYGSGFSKQFASSGFVSDMQISQLYDVLLFVDETTAARPNPGGTRPALMTHTSPKNLDFESGDVGVIPEAWNVNKYSLANFNYIAETSSEQPYRGDKCVKINRSPGKHYGESFASLSQRIDARPYRGKRIRLKAAVRTELKGTEDHAYLWLTVSKAGFGPQSQLFTDRMADRPIAAKEWHEFEITGEVASDAEWISFGMAMVGEGITWFDSFSLDTLEAQTATKSN